jgi:hypothetical protein
MDELGGTSALPLTDLMDDGFISSCSNYSNLNMLFGASGFKVESKEDFAAIPDEAWEEFVIRETNYGSWEEMQKDAFIKYTKRQLRKDLK